MNKIIRSLDNTINNNDEHRRQIRTQLLGIRRDEYESTDLLLNNVQGTISCETKYNAANTGTKIPKMTANMTFLPSSVT